MGPLISASTKELRSDVEAFCFVFSSVCHCEARSNPGLVCFGNTLAMTEQMDPVLLSTSLEINQRDDRIQRRVSRSETRLSVFVFPTS